jgi:O-acetyl-ADP-ribose deacetylase (regulator of RNase III)
MKKLTYVHGDLLRSTFVQVIGHQANCKNVFGSGIAKSIREMYPQAWNADCVASAVGVKTNILGNYSKAIVDSETQKKWGSKISCIYNLYGQNLGSIVGSGKVTKRFDRKTDYEALYNALEGMSQDLRPTEEDKMMFDFDRSPNVGFPYLMGCGLGGAAWPIVERLIETAFDGYAGKVVIYDISKSIRLEDLNELYDDGM